MTAAAVGAAIAPALLQGALVALPRGDALGFLPAAVPVAMTLIALRSVGLPRRPEVKPLVPGTATV